MRRSEPWALAEVLGYAPPLGQHALKCIRLEVGEIVVERYALNENGHKYRDPENPEDAAMEYDHIRYDQAGALLRAALVEDEREL